MEEASLESVLNEIEKVSNSISTEAMKSIRKRESILMSMARPLTRSWESCLKNTDLTYKVIDKYIAIVSKEKCQCKNCNFDATKGS